MPSSQDVPPAGPPIATNIWSSVKVTVDYSVTSLTKDLLTHFLSINPWIPSISQLLRSLCSWKYSKLWSGFLLILRSMPHRHFFIWGLQRFHWTSLLGFCLNICSELWDLIYTRECLCKLCPVNPDSHKWSPVKLYTQLTQGHSKVSRCFCILFAIKLELYEKML